MDETIIRVLRGEAGPVEERRLRNWRDQSPENERHFAEVSAIWAAADPRVHESEPEAPPIPPTETVVRRGEAARRRNVWRRFSRTIRRREIWPLAAAAAVATVSLGIWIGRTGRPAAGPGAAEFVAGNGEAMMATLSDGSFVRLAPQSRLTFSAHERTREAWLTGRAFFAVAHDPELPFVVHTDRGDTRVLGTRFEVDARSDELNVLVVEGRVNVVVPGGESADVSANQAARLGPAGRLSVTTVDRAYQRLDWPGGMLVFQSTPLLEVVAEVGSHFGVTIELADPALTRRTLTAWFGDEPLDEVVEAMCLLVEAECDVDARPLRVGL